LYVGLLVTHKQTTSAQGFLLLLESLWHWPLACPYLTENAVKKQMAALDRRCRAFSSRSPFLVLGTAEDSGRADLTPKGDKPGFTLVLGDQMFVIPKRVGNRRVDSPMNILEYPMWACSFWRPDCAKRCA